MQGHYGSLAADTTGHSLDLQYWHDRQPIQVLSNTPTIRNSDILDQDFSWNQIAAALLQMSPRKAPGDDGITTAFYQAALYMPANTQEGVPPTPFARALLRVCGQVFASATIPRAWLCASIVSIDKKDGDPLNPGDKRGIALINVGLKLVCKVLQMRIERFVETNNLLSYEQAGFRKREECVGQVVSLVDIIQRRQNAGLNTHVLFIDIRKAFDTVPVGALLWKLQNMGFPRRTLAFLKALYTSSSARARAGSLLSDPFPVQRGVRQGCPLSGLLFNLFINDILDGVAPITVPGLPRDTTPIRGLMYADDVAVFADSEQSLLAASTAIEQWANQWEMQFGVAKCGIISFTGHLAPRLDKSIGYSTPWTVVVMGKAYYGLELVGGNKSHLAPLQTTINKGIRLFTGARLSTAIGPLLVETGIGSLLTRSLVSRVRLLERSVTKRTPINAICSGTDNDVFTLNVQGQLVRSQRWFWSRRTKQLYRNRYWLTPQVRPKTVKQRHSFALMETLRTCGDSASLQKYVTRQLLDTSGFFKDPSFDQSRAHGTRYLMLARMDALWTARKAIQIGILVDTHPFSVDRCILCDQQLLSTSIAHLVVECEQVTGHRIQSGLVPAIQKSRLRLLGRALDPGVENVYTWLRGGVLNGEADLDQRWLDGTVEHESMGTRHDNRALAARLADFLQVAYRQYQSTLWKYHRDRLVEDDLWVVVKNLSQQVAAQQAEMDALRNTIAFQQKATANLEKVLSNMASQAASTSEATQAALAAILARLEVKPTPFARALLRVCGQVFASATIPRAWLCASIVSIDKKDGDPLNPGDKRGIALINVGLKLVCKVLQMRIERFVETNNLLSYEQAGFRKREECVGQVVSLVDIIQRRQNAGLNTHVLFIDIRKAFDTVPVGALLWKLQNMGFPRRTLAFLKALYTFSSARARAGSLLSDPFPVQRGVRQGCPLSGLLFNLFINDILDGVVPITVPGLPRDTNPIRGLMYADDVAVFADSEQSLLAASTAIEQWANQWEMQFGVAKCGIISFTGHLAPQLDNQLDIRLHGQLVSRVESYKYLGVLIDSKLDHSAWLKQKRSALEHTISALYPVLANHQLTVNYRSRIFSAVVMGKAYYGLELVGGNKSHLAPLQTTINKGIRLFTGARLSTAIGPLLVETGIGSLLTRSLVSRVRLLERSVTKRTPINAICSGTDNDVFTLNVQGQLVRSQRWFWSRRTKQLYRNRYWLTPQVRPKTVKQRHSFALMETLRTCGDSASLQKYVTRQLLDTSGFFKDPSFDQSRAHGTRYLMLARMDALWTARKAIQIGILVDTHPFSVDHCILCDQQLLSTSIAHLVVECEQVTGHRIQSGLVPAIQKSRLRLLGRALDPGVENVYTWLRGGVLNGEADLDQRWLDGIVEHESMGTRHDNRALAARLADFLQVAYRQYQSTLWKYHRDRLVEFIQKKKKEVKPVVPQVVVPNNKDYPPLPPTGATSKRKTVATKPNPTTTTTTTGQPSKDTRFADAVKRRPTHQQLVERQPEFRKAGAAAWLALKRETSVPANSAPKVELSSGLRLIYASGFPYAKPGDLRKAMQGARIRTSAVRDIRWISRQIVQLLVDADYVSAFTRIITSLDATIVKSFKAWIPRPEAADKDKLAAISSFAAKTVTTIQRSPDIKARNFFRSLLASIGGKTLEAATAEATKIRVQTPGFDISTMETVPKESLPVKKATDKEPVAPAVDSPSDMAAEITPAIQVDGVTPTVTPIADVEMCL
ncbi:hypothetical protein BASA81_015703 [Batrachochytrium salamandrivorans]|nr:hypothetical protein BASA81_015703 [Batrachochytrium salamandrivorans]